VLGFLLSVVVTTGLFMATFRILTNLDLTWKQVFPGAVVGAVGWAILQQLGGWFFSSRVKGASDTYGTFAVVIGLLSWLYLMGQIVVLAAEVNVVLSERLWPRSLSGQDLTEADRRALKRYADVEERRKDERVDAEVPVGQQEQPVGQQEEDARS
jgi:uncharacterized BrkB/YihY/UPF0761 family membrane protein